MSRVHDNSMMYYLQAVMMPYMRIKRLNVLGDISMLQCINLHASILEENVIVLDVVNILSKLLALLCVMIVS